MRSLFTHNKIHEFEVFKLCSKKNSFSKALSPNARGSTNKSAQTGQKPRCPTFWWKPRFCVHWARPIIFGLVKDQKVYPRIKSKANKLAPTVNLKSQTKRRKLPVWTHARTHLEFTAQSLYSLSTDDHSCSLVPCHFWNWRVHSGNALKVWHV